MINIFSIYFTLFKLGYYSTLRLITGKSFILNCKHVTVYIILIYNICILHHFNPLSNTNNTLSVKKNHYYNNHVQKDRPTTMADPGLS